MTGASASPARAGLGSLVTTACALTAIGVTLWLVPASVHIVEWGRVVERVAVFAPLYQLTRIVTVVAIAMGAVTVVATRSPGGAARIARLGHLVAPLNMLWLWGLPYTPWVGERLPLVLVLAGPARWIIAALAVAGVAARLVGRARFAWPGPSPGWRVALVLSALVYAVFGLRSMAAVGLGGDEPHYLVLTHSLLFDGDLQIENNHTEGHYRAFFGGSLRPDYLQRGQNGAIYSIHAPGLAALLMPGYALGGAKGAVMTAVVLAALAAAAVFGVASRLTGPGVAWMVWALVSLTVPFVPHAWALYPEIAGAAIVSWAILWWIAGDDDSGRADRQSGTFRWLWRGVCLSALPWLHTKFSVLLAGLLLMFAWRLRSRWREAVTLVLPVAISGVAWIGFFYVIYGSVDPQVPYGGYTAQFVRLTNVPRSVLGMLFDQKFGLLAYAPVYAFAAVGLWVGHRRSAVVVPVVLAVVYALSSARLYMWWGGSSAPGRFLVPVLPLVAPALACAVARARQTWWGAALFLSAVLSLVIAAVGVGGARQFLLFSPPHGFARIAQQIQGSAPLTFALPTFTEESWLEPAMGLLPWLVAAGAAIAAGRACWHPGVDRVWIAPVAFATFVGGGALLVQSYRPEVRAEVSTRGAGGLLQAFDPVRARAFDYARLARLSPDAWLARAALITERRPGDDIDELGRITDALTLPAGRYETRVWFEGARTRGGALEAIVPGNLPLTRVTEPLANPSVLQLDLPIAAPSLWVRLTDHESVKGVRRVEVVAREVFDRAAGWGRVPARVVEPVSGRLGAYIAYPDYSTFPERGVYWTRGTERGFVLIVPAGARSLELTLHVGPVNTPVSVWVGEEQHDFDLRAEETRTISLPVAPDMRAVPLAVQAGAAFVPAQVDRRSTDMRKLGCQVRIGLE